jgi:hypothetical protein
MRSIQAFCLVLNLLFVVVARADDVTVESARTKLYRIIMAPPDYFILALRDGARGPAGKGRTAKYIQITRQTTIGKDFVIEFMPHIPALASLGSIRLEDYAFAKVRFHESLARSDYYIYDVEVQSAVLQTTRCSLKVTRHARGSLLEFELLTEVANSIQNAAIIKLANYLGLVSKSVAAAESRLQL